MAKYSKMAHTDFENCLMEILKDMSGVQVAAIPGVMDILLEELNNEVLDLWQSKQEEE
jgi:hypothetical protein